MDFKSLNRRNLQVLCKLNKIPANMTNIAMADALKSLETVEGIEEILNSSQSETAGSSIETPRKIEVTSPRVPRTSFRTSTRLKVKKTEEEPLPATVSRTACRGVRRQLAGEVNEFLKTPLVSSTRKKAPTTSCQNVASQRNEGEEVEQNECLVGHETKGVPNTPVAYATYSRRKGTTDSTHQDNVKKETNVQRVYSTRRSTRLTEKKSAEPGAMERERSEPVKIDSFLDEVNVILEEDLGHPVSDKCVGSGSGSMEISHESNISFENKEDNVGEGSVENCNVGVSKAKVEEFCNAFEKLDVLVKAKVESGEEKVDYCGELDILKVKSVEIFEQRENVDLGERQNVGGKFVLNEVDNSEEKSGQEDNLKPDVVLVPEEHSDSLLYDKESLLSEVTDVDADAISFDTENPSDPLGLKLEDTPSAVLEMKNEVSECNVSPNMVGDLIHSNTENPSGPSKLDDANNHNVADVITADDTEENSTKNTVDVVLVDFVNRNEQEPSMDFEAPSEEAQMSTIEETLVDVMPTINVELDHNSEQLNQEAQQTTDEGDKATHESVVDVPFTKEENQFPTNASDVIDHPTDLTPMKKQTLSNSPTSMTRVPDNNENIGRKLQVVEVEENESINEKAGDEKPKSLNKTSMRQLKKQLKALSIKNNLNTDKDDKVAEARPALQAVCDNQLVTGEREK